VLSGGRRHVQHQRRRVQERRGGAPYAAVAASNTYAYEDARDLVGNYQRALETRAVIDPAKGILMERYELTADTAFQALVRVSMQTNTLARDVANTLVRTGVFPLEQLR
jgi:AmiR/NasT family two-component response regulator